MTDVKLSDIEKDIMKLQYQVDTIKASVTEREGEYKEIRDSLYEPDVGLYRRVTSVTENADEQSKIVRALEKKTSAKIDSFDNRIRILEEVQKNLLDIAGSNLEHLRAVITSKKKMEKLWWIVTTAAVGGIVKTIWDVVVNLSN